MITIYPGVKELYNVFAFFIQNQYNWIELSNIVQYSPLQHPSGRRALIIPAMAVHPLRPAIGRGLGLHFKDQLSDLPQASSPQYKFLKLKDFYTRINREWWGKFLSSKHPYTAYGKAEAFAHDLHVLISTESIHSEPESNSKLWKKDIRLK